MPLAVIDKKNSKSYNGCTSTTTGMAEMIPFSPFTGSTGSNRGNTNTNTYALPPRPKKPTINNPNGNGNRNQNKSSVSVRSVVGIGTTATATNNGYSIRRQPIKNPESENKSISDKNVYSYRSYRDNFDLCPPAAPKTKTNMKQKRYDYGNNEREPEPKGYGFGFNNRENPNQKNMNVHNDSGNSITSSLASLGFGWKKYGQKSLSDGNLQRLKDEDNKFEGDELSFGFWNRQRNNNLDRDLRQDFKYYDQHNMNVNNYGLELKRNGSEKNSRGNGPRFFRSISLRNLLQIGGMNKSRQTPAQGKKVSPPTAPPSVPGLVSLASFRVKKNQNHEVAEKQGPLSEKEQQRYSGSSLGSAGSSYASSGSSGSSSSSDNRSSIGTDDGYILPAPNGYHIKELEESVYQHQHQQPNNTEGHLKNSASFDSFTSHHSVTTSVEMHHHHQNLYGKIGGQGNSLNGNGLKSSSQHNGTTGQHVTVHIDPHYPPSTHGSSSTSTHTSGGPPGLPQLQQQNSNVFSSTSHPSPSQPSANHYQTQNSMEDQGIDMTQSPGRESPSSTASSNTGSGTGSAVGSVGSGSGSGSGSNGCRHSTSSFDSGRASSTIYQGVRYSGGLSSESSSGSFRHSYHSSNSSLGSIPPEDICNFDVASMIAQGIPDHEVLNAWLTGIHFECYYHNFIQASYDMHTISRMTPEDLNAIGVTKPHHRKRLKSEISQLSISDGLPDYIPISIEEWLGLLKLEEYNTNLRAQGYHSVRQVTNITWEDLEDTGILKLGHQKKFMLAIKRIEDILAGKRIPQSNTPNAYLTPMDAFPTRPINNTSNGNNMPQLSSQGMPYPHQQHQQSNYDRPNCNTNGAGNCSSYPFARGPPQHQIFRQHPNQLQHQSQSGHTSSIYAAPPLSNAVTLTHQPQLHHSQQTPQYHPEVISIHVRNGRRNSLENVGEDEPIYGTSSFLPSQQQNSQQGHRNSVKSGYDVPDGEVTPTNEIQGQSISLTSTSSSTSTTSTLPRLLKNKPIAKIMASAFDPVPSPSPEHSVGFLPPQQSQYGDGYKSLPRDIGRLSKQVGSLYSNRNSNVGDLYSGGSNTLRKTSTGVCNSFKSGPPPPPRRVSCSVAESGGYGQLSTFQQGSSYADWSSHYPPPPPALSCDIQYSVSTGKSMEELPPPPLPDDLAMLQSHSQQQPSYSHSQQFQGPSTSITMPNNTSGIPSPNYPMKLVTTSSVHQHGHPTVRTSPPTNKSRDPSPVGSDFSDSDLPNNGLLSRGVRRNGSDASFKSNSSTESESIPFANDNAGTIKQQKAGNRATAQFVANASAGSSSSSSGASGAGDVLNDIGNMLADLTDELDAILEQEISSKR